MSMSDTSIGRVAIFNGPPSTGKSSLVNSLQRELTAPWFHLSLDDFRSGYPTSFWDDDEGVLFDRLLAGYVGALREMALAGNNVLAEAVITPARRLLYESTFGSLQLLLIGVKCRLEKAIQREASRTDRRHGPIELPALYFAAVHEGLSYDLEIETSDENPKDLAVTFHSEFEALIPSSFASHLA
jgi:chloramphenicol 3-O-phosphotransferase